MARLVYEATISTNSISKRNFTQLASASSNLNLEKPIPTEIFEVDDSRKDIDASAGMSAVTKSRKRVLTKINDNPLLRPLDTKTYHKVRVSLVGDSENTQRKAPSSSKPQEKGKSDSVAGVKENQSIAFDSDGLSDFMVNDSASLGEESSDSDFQTPPPRSIRRLVRGVRKRSSDGLLNIGEVRPTKNDQAKDDAKLPAPVLYKRELHPSGIRSKFSESNDKMVKESACEADEQKSPVQLSRDRLISSGLELPCVSLKHSPPRHESSHEKFEEAKSETPCSSLKRTQNKLFSPKRLPRIPPTPHRPSIDAFWSQDIINEWNDEYSPRKGPQTRPETDDCESRITPPKKIPSFKSPSRRSHGIVENKKAFLQNRHSMAEAFLKELDSIITEGKLSELAAPTGGIKIIWSKKLNTTAGRANWKLETIRPHTSSADDKQATTFTYRHHAYIELAEKVIDGEDRLLNVIAHEFCHLANFMVSGVKNNPHGKEFKAWAAKCSHVFGGRGIHVTTKHSYEIDYRYVWECSSCGIEFKRHSKSIDTSKHQCGSCKGKLVQIKPKPRSNVTATEYQMFIKNNMKRVKEANPEISQKGIMGLLGKMYKEQKKSKQPEGGEKSHEVDIDAENDSETEKITSGKSTVDVVVRKLEFLDLTSP